MIDRRKFIKIAGGTGIIAAGGLLPFTLTAQDKEENLIITILSTNDMHSRIDPFPANDRKFAGCGGMAMRASVINAIRNEGNEVLVLDAGDIFQGTPYYNVYKGALEIRIMNMIGYDAATLGNHEFDDGLDNIHQQITNAHFPFICSNYDFSKTKLANQTETFKIFEKGKIKVGVYGLGIEPKGLISRKNYGDLVYNDPIEIAQKMEKKLKEEGCQLIIAISHLGYSYNSKKVSDLIIAQQTYHTNLIVGGHTHTFLETATVQKNQNQNEVIISQSGWGGINLGRTDFIFSKKFIQIVNAFNTTKIIKNQV